MAQYCIAIHTSKKLICCFLQVVVQNIDYGWTETVWLKCLCELPPGFSDLPPQVMQSKLAGIQKRPGLQMYPDTVKNMLIAVKRKRKVFRYSAIISV